MKDIYLNMGLMLLNSGYWDLDVEGKKEQIDLALRTYMAQKLAVTPNKINELVKLDAGKLMEMLEEKVAPEERLDKLSQIIHYVINIAGELQGYSIVWYISEDEFYIKHPEVSFDEYGKWDSVTSHKETTYSDTFNAVYGTMQSKFLMKR